MRKDPWKPSLFLFFEEEETLAPAVEEPEFYPMNVILDSGASDHVASKEDIPGQLVVPSVGSKARRNYVDASGNPIPNQGESTIAMQLPAGNARVNDAEATFQVADVSRPLLSASKICEKGNDVLCRKDAAYVLDANSKVIAKFEKRNGLYVATLSIKNPKYKDFHRQA